MSILAPSTRTILGICISCVAIASLIMTLRFYTYFYIDRKKNGWILTSATAGWVFGCASTLLFLYTMYKSAINPTIYWMVGSEQAIQILGVMLVKLSMTLYILHLQGPVYPIGRWILICAAVINLITAIVVSVLILLPHTPCNDVRHMNVSRCHDYIVALASVSSLVPALTDILLLVYPVIMMWNRRISIQQKISVCILLSLGTVGTLVSIVNYLLVFQHDATMEATMLFNLIGLWTILIASSAAPLWPLFRALSQSRALRRVFSELRRKEQSPSGDDFGTDFETHQRSAISQTGIENGDS